MPKIGMEPIRKAQLIEATFECIYRYGFAGTTIERVARQAGVSKGIISHYFGDKDGLLEATMRGLVRQLDINARTRNRHSTDPKERIIAIIGSNFAEQQVTPEAITVWLAFWAQARLAGYFNNDSGYIDNSIGKDKRADDTISVRAMLNVDFNDDTSLLLIGQHTDIDTRGGVFHSRASKIDAGGESVFCSPVNHGP